MPLLIRKFSNWAFFNYVFIALFLALAGFGTIVFINSFLFSSPYFNHQFSLTLKYALFFFIGAALQCNSIQFSKFLQPTKTVIALALFSIAMYLVSYFGFYSQSDDLPRTSIQELVKLSFIAVELPAGYFASILFFALMARLYTAPNKICLLYTSDAADE